MFCTGAAPTVPGDARHRLDAGETLARRRRRRGRPSRARPAPAAGRSRAGATASARCPSSARARRCRRTARRRRRGWSRRRARASRLAVGPRLAQRGDELVGRCARRSCARARRRCAAWSAGERDRCRRRASAQASRTRTCALPSTVVSPCVTVRSMRAVSSSTAPTFATIVQLRARSGSTTTGRVKRTP